MKDIINYIFRRQSRFRPDSWPPLKLHCLRHMLPEHPQTFVACRNIYNNSFHNTHTHLHSQLYNMHNNIKVVLNKFHVFYQLAGTFLSILQENTHTHLQKKK